MKEESSLYSTDITQSVVNH